MQKPDYVNSKISKSINLKQKKNSHMAACLPNGPPITGASNVMGASQGVSPLPNLHNLQSIILFEHYKTGKLHFLLLMSVKSISLQKKNFFQKKGFHFYYCNYCGGCLNGMTEKNIQAH